MSISEIAVLKIDAIGVPQILQREFSITHAKDIIQDFQRELLGTLTVCKTRIPGRYLVVDGRHRLYAAKYKGLHTLNCVILPEMGEAEMAKIFRGIAKVKKISALDKFRSEVRSNEPDSVAIQTVCDKYHIPIGTMSTERHVRGFYLRAVNVARIIMRDYGLDRLDQTFKVITSAWAGQPYAMYENTVHGVAIFLEYFGRQSVFDENRAINQFGKHSAESVLNEGKSRSKNRGATPAIEIATPVLRNIYNYRTLVDKQLRTSPELEELAFKHR